MSSKVEAAYELARDRYAELGVDTEAALGTLAATPISLHCWQGDDVAGFEDPGRGLSGGLMATGDYPGKARTVSELRADLERAFGLIPGRHRLNLHAIYLDSPVAVARDELEPRHFESWAEWGLGRLHGIDFNPTLFSHPLADDGFTLSHRDEGVRRFWIDHCRASRRIGAYFGRRFGTPAVTNVWIPDGFKDTPVDRLGPRERLQGALDEVFSEELPATENLDAVESKLFGLGSESYVVGSHEFYLGYAARRGTLLCLDAGHFHPTESISDKISATLLHVPGLLLHVSRGVRWDSDHVVTLTDDLLSIMEEVVRGRFLDRVHVGLDFFDASINRVAAWVIGTRATQQALLRALLEPTPLLRELEANGDYTGRLALLEGLKGLPYGAVWDAFCLRQDVPVGTAYLEEVRAYEREVAASRDRPPNASATAARR